MEVMCITAGVMILFGSWEVNKDSQLSHINTFARDGPCANYQELKVAQLTFSETRTCSAPCMGRSRYSTNTYILSE